MKSFKIKNSKPIAGHYSSAILSNNFLFISGQVPVNPVTGKIVKGSFETQFQQVLDNLKGILESAGLAVDDLVKVNIMIVDGEKWYVVNEMCKEFFGKHKPARTVLPVLPLHNGYQVELEAIAELKKEEK